jgi:RHH-type transcriptional regulator, rel operon repressor / antitoxin RelB
MSQITARLPDDIVTALDKAASSMRRSRADIVRQAIELYLEDYADLSTAIAVLRDPSDEILNWEEVRSALLNSDQE